MLNEDLIYPQSVNGLKKEIRKLRGLIFRYKQHDEERTKYYADKMKELGELQSLLSEYKDTNEYFNQNELYKKQLFILERKLYLQNVIDLSDEDALQIGDYKLLYSQYCKLKRRYESLQVNYSELIYKLYNNENKES